MRRKLTAILDEIKQLFPDEFEQYFNIMTDDALELLLKINEDEENFEACIKIRDELNKRKK